LTLVSSIIVNRGERQRKELKGIPELAESIARLGLIHPIVVDENNVLIAGERRLTAVKSLGWTSVDTRQFSDLDELTQYAIELEENVKRLDITWQEQCLAVANYHTLRTKQNGDQSQSKTADELGMTKAEVSQKIGIAQQINSGNERVAKADKYSTARNIVERDRSRRIASAGAEVTDKLAETFDAVTPDIPVVRSVPLLNEDFHEWAAAYCGPKFNMIHCDFPYGVGMHKSDQGAGQEFGEYEDTKGVYFELLATLEMAMSNVVADSAHLVFWFAMDYYEVTREALREMGWQVNPYPLIWHKTDNTGIIPDAQRGPRRVYETAFFASRGDRKLTQKGAVSNVFGYAGRGKEIHMNEKPVAMLQHFLGMFVDEYSRVLDPTAGSANALKAAEALGAGAVLGLERDPDFFQRSTEMYFGDPA
jgi:ParB family chromosome partitioning protein